MPWWRTASGWALGARSGGRRRTLLSWHNHTGMQSTTPAALTHKPGYQPSVLITVVKQAGSTLQRQAFPTRHSVTNQCHAQCLLNPGKGS